MTMIIRRHDSDGYDYGGKRLSPCTLYQWGVKNEDGDMDSVTAWMVAIIGLVTTVVLTAALVRRWNRENRRRYPERASSRFFEINRKPRH